jgi:hypothetical protein
VWTQIPLISIFSSPHQVKSCKKKLCGCAAFCDSFVLVWLLSNHQSGNLEQCYHLSPYAFEKRSLCNIPLSSARARRRGGHQGQHDAEFFRGDLDPTFAFLGYKEEEKEAGKKRSPASDALSDYHFYFFTSYDAASLLDASIFSAPQAIASSCLQAFLRLGIAE